MSRLSDQQQPAATLADTSKLRLEFWPIDRLLPSPRNARTHSDAQVAEIAGSIRAFGFSNPILVGEDRDVVAGHGRLAAARLLGLAEVPVIVLVNLSEIQRRQLMLADNRIALNAGWDPEMLQLELRDLSALGTDLSTLGFTKQELAKALTSSGGGLTDEDEIPEVAETPVSQPGDVWLLGEHRVVCGDSTDADVVEAAVGERSPNLMVTDPPYGVEYDPTWRERYDKFKRHARGKVENDDRADWTPAWKLFKGSFAYVWHGGLHSATVQASLEEAGFQMRAQIIWAKQHFVFGRGHYHWQHEPCWYAVRSKGEWAGDRKQTTLWSIPNHNPMGGSADDETTGHGTQKPVECMRRPILNNSNAGEVVYEPFLGSGTTLIAAESTGRVCVGIELNPVYVDVVVRRWQAFTGRQATLESSGQTFGAAAAERQQAIAPTNDAKSETSMSTTLTKPKGGLDARPPSETNSIEGSHGQSR